MTSSAKSKRKQIQTKATANQLTKEKALAQMNNQRTTSKTKERWKPTTRIRMKKRPMKSIPKLTQKTSRTPRRTMQKQLRNCKHNNQNCLKLTERTKKTPIRPQNSKKMVKTNIRPTMKTALTRMVKEMKRKYKRMLMIIKTMKKEARWKKLQSMLELQKIKRNNQK